MSHLSQNFQRQIEFIYYDSIVIAWQETLANSFHEQRVKAGATEAAVVSAAVLVALERIRFMRWTPLWSRQLWSSA